MTTEITSQLPPCPLPDCGGGEHHYHDIDAYTVNETPDCARAARIGYRCYSPHRRPQWQPSEHDQIRAGMRIWVTSQWDDRVTFHVGVAHHQAGGSGVWLTEARWPLVGWGDSTAYEVDPATIPADPDAELIEKIALAIRDADESTDEWGEDPSSEAYRKQARVALDAVRESEVEEVVIEAMQLAGTTAEIHAVYQWVEANTLGSFEPLSVIEGRKPYPASGVSIDPRDGRLIISTLEGLHWADPGDWIIRGVAGEFYPCKEAIFRETYEPVEEVEA